MNSWSDGLYVFEIERNKLSEYNLKVVYMEMKEPGFYYPKPRIIFE